MEKETGENVRTETVVLPEGKIEFELDDAEEMFQIGDEAFPEGNFTQAQEGEERIHPNLSRATEILLPIGKLAGKKRMKTICAERTRRYPQGTGRET